MITMSDINGAKRLRRGIGHSIPFSFAKAQFWAGENPEPAEDKDAGKKVVRREDPITGEVKITRQK